MAEAEYNPVVPVKRLGRFIRSERKIMYLILFYALINGIIVLTLPLGIQAILNFILGGRVSSSWFILIVIVISGLIASGAIQIAQLSLTEKLQQRIFAQSSFSFAIRLPRIKIDAMQNRYAPEMVNQFFDTVTLQKGIAKLLVDFPTATLQVFFGLILISVYHPFFLFFSVAVLLTLYILFRYTMPIGIVTSLKESAHKYEVAHWLEELARTMGTFKLAGITNLPLIKVDKLVMGYLYFRQKHFAILMTQFRTMIAFKVISVGTLLIMGSLLLIDGQISLGQFVAAEIIIILIMNSIEKLIVGLEDVYDVLTSVEKIGAVIDLPLEEEKVRNPRIISACEAFEVGIEDLGFSYPGTERRIINGFNLTVKAGEKIAIAGRDGSGKSTLLQLITGLYDHYQGRITYNGIPLSALCHDHLRLAIGDNIWHEAIFKGTLRENITLGKKGVTDDEVTEVLEAVSATEPMNMLDDGLNTMLSSGGQRIPKSFAAKIILARAVVYKPKLILFEDDTAALHQFEQRKFLDYLFSQSFTVIATSNGSEFLKRAHRTLFIDKGMVVFDGSYTDLISNDSYARYIR